MTTKIHFTHTEFEIISVLIANEESYGLEIVDQSDGKVKRGSVYVLLSRLEDKGFIESRLEEQKNGMNRPQRRLYKLTGLGARAYKTWINHLRNFELGTSLAYT